MEQDYNQDCSFAKDKNRFRYRAAAIIIENDCVLLASNETVDYFYSIGGAVHLGETAEKAVVREVIEETGVQYEIERLAFVHENFFTDDIGFFNGIDCHEVAFYFLMKQRGTKKLNSNSYCMDGKEFMNWMPISELKNHKIYPIFFAEKLAKLAKQVEHIVTIEDTNE